MTLILGIESSCDETAAAIVDERYRVVAECVQSQAEAFAAWGGVVPELAARGHIQHLPQVIAEVCSAAGITGHDCAGVAVSCWPGLMGSLLCGVTAAKVLALRWNKPLLAVDHIQAHLSAALLGGGHIAYPAIGLVASGGHSHFYLCNAPDQRELIGGTIDDAAGEAFDKAAAILGLGYPGGPIIDRLAADGNPKALALPRSLLHSGDLRLSFAGLKTALLYKVRGPCGKDPLNLSQQGIADAAASFQAAVVDVLVAKLLSAARKHQAASLVIGGGVACNRGLRQTLTRACADSQLSVHMPEPRHCADNAAMIAVQGHLLLASGSIAHSDLSPLPTGAAGPRQRSSSPAAL